NMAGVVWATLEKFNLVGRILAFMMDNASNNDTLVDEIERKCHAKNIPFNATHSRLRCMPHTVHLAVLKLLEAIGAVEKDSKKSTEPYQDAVTSVPGDADLDAAAAAVDDLENDDPKLAGCSGIKASVYKLRKIVRSVRSSPQRRQHWYQIIMPTDEINVGIHMLILDVKTRWSSTHQLIDSSVQSGCH
ncbi:hypothetical protein BDP27DRAFT_1230053, partial [Rhodocollybia butyracea]